MVIDKITNLFNNLDNLNVTQYMDPCNIWVVDDFLPADIFERCLEEVTVRPIWDDAAVKEPRDYVLRYEYNTLEKTPITELVINYLNAGKFVRWIENKSSHKGLLSDPYLHGGGVCKIPAGKTLTVHKDFNWNDKIKCNHVVNACLYMNTGGDLEFWSDNNEMYKIEVKPNRLVFWEDADRIRHGFNNTLTADRTNIVLFYYKSNGTPPSEVHNSYD